MGKRYIVKSDDLGVWWIYDTVTKQWVMDGLVRDVLQDRCDKWNKIS